MEKLEKFKRAEGNFKERIANLYLAWLGLGWDYLRGKKVLDIGAGPGEFAEVAKEHGIDVVSLDNMVAEAWKEEIPPPSSRPKAKFVIGDAMRLPFADNSFDLIVSRAGPLTTFIHSEDDIRPILREVKRVLKDGGEFRFCPGLVSYVSESESDGDSGLSEEGVRKDVDSSYGLLKKIDPGIAMEENNIDVRDIGENKKYFYSYKHYYSLKK